MEVGGLTAQQAEQRAGAEGRNELPAARRTGWFAAIAGQLSDPVVLVLLAAAVLTLAVGDLIDLAVILAVIVVNTALGAGQEVRSARALDALADLTAPRASVRRDGAVQDVDARDVVRGDLLYLAAGDIVAADARLVSAEALSVDESMLTGESVPVDKQVGDTVFAATIVVRGRASAEVVTIGHGTALGGIAGALAHGARGRTPLQRQLAGLGRRLAVAVGVVAVFVAAINLLAGRGVETSLVLAISLAVAAIPESLPTVVSLSLAMAARRMAGLGVLTRRLAAVEGLGSITVLAVDKTGTVTQGRMALSDTWMPVAGDAARRRLLEAAALCNDAPASGQAGAERADPTEVALVLAAEEAGIDVAVLRAGQERVAEVPFDAATARMTTVHRLADGRRREICKGAPEAVLRELADASGAREAADRFARSGLRVLAVAERVSGHGWDLLGLVTLGDPPRPDAPALIGAFRAAGVRPVMITGDHPATADAVARAVGINAVGGRVSAGGADPEAACSVYARVLPHQKTAVVQALQAQGEIVAMTGDGVNDAPALRAADIGVAMGRRGTEVAKQAADLVLTTDDLSAMAAAIGEGRRAYDNLRRFLHYALSGGTAEILVVLLGPLLGFPIALQAGQILWINLLTHGLPGAAMGNEPARSDVLTRSPRRPGQALLDRALASRVLVLGAAVAAVSLLAAVVADRTHRPWQSCLFLTLGLAQLAVAWAVRARRGGTARNPLLEAAIALDAVLAVLAVQWHPLRALLRLQRLGVTAIAGCLLLAAVAAVVARWQVRRDRTPSREA